jgi:FMN phosphatase YigB (HAD superfamily)
MMADRQPLTAAGRLWSKAQMANHWQTVIFVDLDATILRGPFESAVFPVVLGEMARKTGLEVKEIRRLVTHENLDRQRKPGIPAALAMDWDDIFKTVAWRLGVELEARAVEIASSHAAPPYAAILDGADLVLRQLASPRRAIVAATKGLSKYQLPVLNALGLTASFTDILTPDVNGVLKHDLGFYGQWPQSAHLQISVGDHYEDDVAAPKRFGFKSIWKVSTLDDDLQQLDPFDRPVAFRYEAGQTVRPDAILFALRELPTLITRLEEFSPLQAQTI